MQSPTITTVLNGSNRTLFVDFDEAMRGLRANLSKSLDGKSKFLSSPFLFLIKRITLILNASCDRWVIIRLPCFSVPNHTPNIV